MASLSLLLQHKIIVKNTFHYPHSANSLKLFSLYIIFILSGSHYAYTQPYAFGSTGILGLSTAQLVSLSKGDIVFLSPEKNKAGSKSALTEAAIVFSSSPEEAWKLISKTEDQAVYIDGCIEVKVLFKSPSKANEVHKVGNKLLSFTYGVIQNYLPESKCIYWTLDPGYLENDLNDLTGYWQLYPYGDDKTLARYGSYISFKSIPQFIENRYLKSSIKDALDSVKKYVDSYGTYRK